MSTKPHENTNDKWADYFIESKYDEAIKALNKELQSETDELIKNELKVWLAYSQFKINDKKGLKQLEDLLTSNPNKFEVHLDIARIFMWENHLSKAISILEKAIEKFKNNFPIVTLLAECYRLDDETEKAIELLNKYAPEQNPEVALSFAQIFVERKEIEQAREIIHSTYINFPTDENIRYTYSRIALEINNLEVSLYLLNNLTIQFPDKAEYWGYLSNCAVQLELYDTALVACRKAEELTKGEQEWIVSNIGNILNNKGFYSEGIKYFEKGLIINKNSEYAHNRLAGSIKLREKEQERLQTLCKTGRKNLKEYKGKTTNIE